MASLKKFLINWKYFFVLAIVIVSFFVFQNSSIKADNEPQETHDAATAFANTPYPRTFLRYLPPNLTDVPEAMGAVANWDIVDLSVRVPASEITQLRALNPDVVIGRDYSLVSVDSGAGDRTYVFERGLFDT